MKWMMDDGWIAIDCAISAARIRWIRSGIPVDARGKERERRGRSTGFDGVKTTFRRTRMRVDGRTRAGGVRVDDEWMACMDGSFFSARLGFARAPGTRFAKAFPRPRRVRGGSPVKRATDFCFESFSTAQDKRWVTARSPFARTRPRLRRPVRSTAPSS